jgi:hypothetical protein
VDVPLFVTTGRVTSLVFWGVDSVGALGATNRMEGSVVLVATDTNVGLSVITPASDGDNVTGIALLLSMIGVLLAGCMTGTSVSNSTVFGAVTTATDCRLGASEGAAVEGDVVVRGNAVDIKNTAWTDGALVSTLISGAPYGTKVGLAVGCIVVGTCGEAEGLSVVRRVGRLETVGRGLGRLVVVLVGATRVVGTGDAMGKTVGTFVAITTDGAVDGLAVSSTTGSSVEGSGALDEGDVVATVSVGANNSCSED